MSINSIIISGNITRDPELRSTSGGMSVLSFSVAVNERRKNGGEWEDYANFIDCTMFGTRADAVSRYIGKGSHVCVAGHVRQDRWEGEQGKRSKLYVIVDEIDFTASKAKQAQPEQTEYAFDDIPF